MSTEVTIHSAQTSILRELLFRPQAGYTELQKPTGLTSDHFNFHIGRLTELGLVEKVARGTYRLSAKGKEYANRMDTDNNTVERQPKCTVIPAIERINGGKKEYIFQERLKNPYYGFWSLPSGKIRWGESIVEAAAREALEETGLEAMFEAAGVYHERVYEAETGDLLEDKIFFVVRGTHPKGDFTADFEGGHNEWLTPEAASRKGKIFDSLASELQILTGRQWLVERVARYSKADF
ncbi:MAG TPA: NUDIX domain-containing protein [Candidatus Saccharimonadales bacterium]|nr:NUDIX domain-containing protein [Candidatus Saccharimonadales bacterium]